MKKFSELKINNEAVNMGEESHYRCQRCKDKGFYFVGDIAMACSCKRPAILELRREKAGITPHLAKQTFHDFDFSFYSADKRGGNKLTYRDNAATIVKAAQGFTAAVAAGENPDGLLFQGAVGYGKTYLAAACANDLIEKDIAVRFVVVPDFLDLIRDSFNDHSPYRESVLMQEVKTAPVLILDDLGAHNYTDWSVKTIFAILNYRLNYELPTVITTNLEREQLEELLGSRVYSRLLEMCRFFRLENANDIRWEKRIREKRKS